MTAQGSSMKSVAARCEPFSTNRLTPASRNSGAGQGTMVASVREQAASCDAFVLSRRRPAPDAPPSRTSPAGLIDRTRPPRAPRLTLPTNPRSYLLSAERHLPRMVSAASAASKCEPVPAFLLLPRPPTGPAWPSAASAAAGCEPFSPNRLTPASCDSGSWSGTMAAGAREQAASCDAFVLSRRRPAPDAPLKRGISFAKIRGFKVADYNPRRRT